ncbi:hypothetical protein BJX70DRAFT_408490 [Aspergillus crustosus]
MKVAKSCSQCRTAKRKCTSGTLPLSSCTQCAQKGINCSLLVNQNSNRPKFLAPAAPGPRSSVEPHTFFHPGTLTSRVQSGLLPEAVLFSILAVDARFSSDQSIRDRVNDFYQAAKEAFKDHLEEITLDNIHATALIGNISGAEGNSNGESLFFGIGFRIAQILRLPESNREDDAITKEIKIRTYWSLYMIDQWSSAGLDMPRQLSDTSQHPLPMSELLFWGLKPGSQALDTIEHKPPALWGYMAIIASVFGKIHQLHRQLADGYLTDTETEKYPHVYALELEDFVQNLPTNLELTRDNLEYHAAQGLGATFVTLHLGYHHYSTLLYFHYLDSTFTQVPNQTIFAARCKHHAAAFSDLLSSSNEIPGCEAVYFIVAHMTSRDEIPDARRRLYSNFQALLKLKQYWPYVSTMITRLFTFQEVCMRSTDRVYVVDKWIVKFLLQHALPIEKNRHPPPTD